MKSIFLTIIILGLSHIVLFSQTVNSIPIKDLNVEYIRIEEFGLVFSNGCYVELDYGQVRLSNVTKSHKILDDSGKVMHFNSILEALNLMDKIGYEYINSNIVSLDSSSCKNQFLLRRKRVELSISDMNIASSPIK